MEQKEQKPNYYAVIPAEVRYADIPASAKLLYGEITALCNKEGYCWATNQYFAELYGVSKITVSRWISKLAEKGFINIELQKAQKSLEVFRKLLIPINKNVKGGINKNVMDNNTSINNTNNNNVSIGGLKPADLEVLFYKLVKELGFTDTVKYTETRKRKLKQRLKDFDETEIIKAAKNIAADGFMQGDNPTGKKYGDIDYLIRNSETLERWLLAGNGESEKEFINRGLKEF